MNHLIRSCAVVLLSTAVLVTSLSRNDTPIDELRRPRVVGRIVKLYSGSKPEPVACAGEGYRPDPADCAVFYRCIKGGKEKYTVFRFQCGPGTIYDPDTEVCNHPKSTKRTECFATAQEAASQTDTNNENEIDFSKSQELPSPIKVNKLVYDAHNAVKRNDMSETTAIPFKTTSKTLVLNQKPRQPNQQGDACTTDGFMGDSENCRKFYRCVGNGRGSYIRYEFSCSETTIWDDEVQSCNHPGSVKRQRCGRGINKNTDTTQQKNPDSDAETIQEQPQSNNYGSKVSILQEQINNRSKIENQPQINYGDRFDQSQRQENYSSDTKPNKKQTSKVSTIGQSQPQINHGNDALQSPVLLDTIKQTSQKQTQASESDDENDGGYNNNNNSNQEKPQDPHVTESNAGNSNEKQCSSSGFMGDPDNCKKFYRCVDNGKGGYTRYEFSCGDGTVWDASIEGCNHAWAVKKCNENAPADSATTTAEATSAVTTAAPTRTTSRPDTTTQSSTTNQASTTDDDDEDTGYGNQNQVSASTTTSAKPTDAPQVTTEGTSTSDETVCTHNGFTGDKSDCKKFYRCVDNGRGGYIKYEFACGDGTVWDSEIQACNHAWAVERCGGAENSDFNKEETTTQKETAVTSRPSSTTETEQTENNEDDNGYGPPFETSPTVTTTETQQTSAPVSTSNNKCSSSGFMGDQNDCKKFYRCVDDGKGSYTRYEFSCGEGTVWDQTIEGCNHAWAVKKCGNSAETQTLPQNEVTTQKVSTTTSSTSDTDDDQEYNPPVTSTETSSTTQSSGLTENPSKGKECTEEGFYADEDDCRKFYRCVDDGKGGYTKYEFTCGEGTVWDSAIQGCNHPSNENNCKNSGAAASTTSPSNEPDREDDEIYTETTSKTTTTTTDISQTSQPTTTKRPQTSTGTCESEGFYPDPNDCKKFYRCVDDGNGGYTKYDFTCGDGTVWDQNIQGCNHESENRECKGSSSSNNGQQNQETSTQQNQETINQESTTESQRPIQVETSSEPPTDKETTTSSSGDQEQCSSDGFFANTSDCKKFYRCVSDGKGGYTRYDFTCGDGTVWVQEIQACDHDNDVNSCSSQNSVSSSTSSPQTTQQSNTDDSNQQTSSNPSTSTQSQTPPDEYSTESPSSSSSTTASSGQCTSEGFYPNENDCTKFYRCVDNGNNGYTKYDFACGEGTAWDSNIQACNHKSEVESCSGSSQEKPETPPMQDEPAETQSTTSTTTTSGSGSTTTTSTSGPCTNNSDSEKPTSSTDECMKEGYYGNSQDCTKFYRCVDNGKGGYTKYDYQCGEGTIWDQDVTTCNHPGDVNNPSCNNQDQNSNSPSSTTSSIQEEPSSTSQSSTQSSSTTESNNQGASNCSQEDSTKKPGKSQVNCTKAGFYPDPNDCKKFYRCVDWDGNGQHFSVFHFDCGEGTIWDPQLDTCNYEDSVYPPRDCSGTDTQSETPQETTTTTKSTTTTQGSTTTTEREQTSTTEQQTTPEKTTTQQSTTSEHTTTQQSSATEQTITQQSTTSEKTTTQQSTTSEPTTTEQSTTSEPTATEPPTTSQQTTTEQSTTTQQTTTEQSTTSEQTTTEPTTASEQTTTEQSTTSEQTTTEQSTTSEQTTTEQSSTSEQTTTEQSTTTEQTTTQQSTTSEDTITTQSTTSEETTTQQSTTEQSTSDSTTTQQQDSSTTESSTEQQTTTEQSSSKPDKCPETDDDQYTYVCPTGFRRHPKYCNLFYQCTEDDETHEVKIATFTCPNNTIYDENKTQCVEESKADKKCDGQIAQKRRVKRLDAYIKEPMVVSKEKHNCPAVGHFPFERQDECSPAFLKCERSKSGKLRGFVYQCPDGFVYWAVSRRCEPMSNMRGCKQTANNWSGRWEIPVERRNVAP